MILKTPWPWTVLLFGIALTLAGAALVAAYVLEVVAARWGQPDQSPVFWYLPILFLGVTGLAAGGIGVAAGYRRLRKINAPDPNRKGRRTPHPRGT